MVFSSSTPAYRPRSRTINRPRAGQAGFPSLGGEGWGGGGLLNGVGSLNLFKGPLHDLNGLIDISLLNR